MELQDLLLSIALAKVNIVCKILQSINILQFIIKFPKIKSECVEITIFPVSQHDTMLRLEDKIIADCDGEIHTVINCSVTSGATFCQLAHRRSCAQELHAGAIAHCDIQHSDLHPITYVDEGIIIVNGPLARVSVDNATYIHIRGTHLITFSESAREWLMKPVMSTMTWSKKGPQE